MMSRAEIIQTADARLRQAGLFPNQIVVDGHKHRCPVEGKPKGQDGEYRIYADDRPRVVWKNYRTGNYGTDKLYSTEAGNSFDRAEYILSKAVTAVSNHPYLVRKGVTVPPGLKMKDGKLIVPAYDAEGETAAERDTLTHLARIGSNINQIARWANTHAGQIDAIEILMRLDGLQADRPITVTISYGNWPLEFGYLKA